MNMEDTDSQCTISPKISKSIVPLPTDFDTSNEKYEIFINPANMTLENEDQIFVFSRTRQDAYALATENKDALNEFVRQQRVNRSISSLETPQNIELPTLKINSSIGTNTLSLGYLYDITETVNENTVSENRNYPPSIPHFDSLDDEDHIHDLYQSDDEGNQDALKHHSMGTGKETNGYKRSSSLSDNVPLSENEDGDSIIHLSTSDNPDSLSFSGSLPFFTSSLLAAEHSSETMNKENEHNVIILDRHRPLPESSPSETSTSDGLHSEKERKEILQQKDLIIFCGYNSIIQSIMNNLLNQDKHFSYILVINKERDEQFVESNRVLFLERDILDYSSYTDINLYECKRIVILPLDDSLSISLSFTEGEETTPTIHPGDIIVATILQYIYKILYNDGMNDIVSPHTLSSCSFATTSIHDDTQIQITNNLSAYPVQYEMETEEKHKHILDFRYFYISKCLVYIHNEQSIYTLLPYLPPYILNQSNKYYLSPAFMNGSIYVNSFMNAFTIQYFNNPLLLELIFNITTGNTTEVIPSLLTGKYHDKSQLKMIRFPATQRSYIFSDVFKYYLEKQNTLILGLKTKSSIFDHSTIPYLIPDPQTPVNSDDYLFVLSENDSI